MLKPACQVNGIADCRIFAKGSHYAKQGRTRIDSDS